MLSDVDDRKSTLRSHFEQERAIPKFLVSGWKSFSVGLRYLAVQSV